MEKIDSFSNRLAEIMKENSWNYDQFAKKLEMRPQTLNRYVLGQREPKMSVVTEIADKLHVDPMWLQGYDVSRDAKSNKISPKYSDDTFPQRKLVPVIQSFNVSTQELYQQNIVGYMPATVNSGEFFYYSVPDDSLLNLDIQKNDLVLVKIQNNALNGQIVLCSPNGTDVILQRVSKYSNLIVLQSENKQSKPSLYKENAVRIIGIVINILRNFEE